MRPRLAHHRRPASGTSRRRGAANACLCRNDEPCPEAEALSYAAEQADFDRAEAVEPTEAERRRLVREVDRARERHMAHLFRAGMLEDDPCLIELACVNDPPREDARDDAVWTAHCDAIARLVETGGIDGFVSRFDGARQAAGDIAAYEGFEWCLLDALAPPQPRGLSPQPVGLLESPRLCSPERLSVWRAWMERCWGTGFAHGDYLCELFTELSRRSRIGMPDVAEGADLLSDAVAAGWIERLGFQPTVSQQFLGMAGVMGGANLRRAVAMCEQSRLPGDRNAFALGYGYAPNRACAEARTFVVEGMR